MERIQRQIDEYQNKSILSDDEDEEDDDDDVVIPERPDYRKKASAVRAPTAPSSQATNAMIAPALSSSARVESTAKASRVTVCYSCMLNVVQVSLNE